MNKHAVTTLLLVLLFQSSLFAKTNPNDNAKSQFELNTQLIKTIEDLDVEGVKNNLTEGANPNVNFPKFGDQYSPIRLVIFKATFGFSNENPKNIQKCRDILQALFVSGAQEQFCDGCVLHMAACENLSVLIEILLKNGFKPDGGFSSLMTPAEVAEQNVYTKTALLLYSYGAKHIDRKTINHLQFIHYADKCNIPKMEKLFYADIDINKPDKEDKTALIQAVNSSEVGSNWYATILYLLKRGACPNVQGSGYTANNETAIHTASRRMGLAQIFASENPQGKIYGGLVMESLLEKGNPNSRNTVGQTALHIAAKWDNLGAAVMLIEAGAKISYRDNDGKAPLDYANSAEMIKLLKSYGAKKQ